MDRSPAEVPVWIREHVQRYLSTDGERGHLWDSTFLGGPGPVPTLLLTTRGRRSGRPRTWPLIYGKRSDGDYVVVASRGGHPEHPSWYRNLCADPRVEVQVRAERFTAHASATSGTDRDELWQQMTKLYPPYRDYATLAAAREIPVIRLSPGAVPGS